MRYELKLHRITFGILAIVLTAFVIFLLRVHPGLADERLVAIVSLTIVVAAASAFVTMGIVEGTMAFQFGKKHKRELLSYLMLGLLSVACGLYLTISDTASLQTIAIVAAPHALLFGLGELRLARHLGRHAAYKGALFIGGVVELSLGMALIGGSRLSSVAVATLLAYVAILSVLQLFPLLFYWERAKPQPTH